MTRDEMIERAEAAFENGDATEARRLLEAASRAGPPTARLLGDLGVVLHAAGDTEGARVAFERGLALEGDDETLRENLARLEPPRPRGRPSGSPVITAIVPTYERPELVRRLVRDLERQTLDADLFEVIVVDDGSKTDVAAACADLDPPFAFRLITKENGGPGSARNAALPHARGEYLLFLNDDGRPDRDLLEEHLRVHFAASSDIAVLGSFPYSDEARASPFVRMIEKSGFTFGYPDMKPGSRYGWLHFWTCNISVRRSHVQAVDGFDEQFCDPMSEDIELGWRLQRDRNVTVLYHPRARCVHEHRLTVAGFIRRQQLFGKNHYKLFRKYDNPGVLLLGFLGPYDDRMFDLLDKVVAKEEGPAADAKARLEAWEAGRAPLLPGFGPDDEETYLAAHEYAQILTSYNFTSGLRAEQLADRAATPSSEPGRAMAGAGTRE